MAGIGFELRRMIDERQGFINKARAYACAGLISSGPWLMTILTLTLLNVVGPYVGGEGGYSLFRALVTYAFAFSLILQGILQMAVTRRVADWLYAERYDRVLPAFAATLLVVGLVHTAIGAVFCGIAGFGTAVGALATSLFAIVGMTWMALIWLSIVRQYDQVLRAYVHGTVISMLGIVLLALGQGTTGILAAYTAGQAFILVRLTQTIMRGMETGGKRDFAVLKAVTSLPGLVAVGFLYNAAIWVDKMIFWFRDGIGPHPMVRYHPLYDTCSFLAYLTVVPALAVNLVRLETSFYEKYRAYYGAILGGTPLAVIEDRRARMFENLREGVVKLVRVQGALTAAVILFAPFIIDALELPLVGVRLFRLTCLGAFFHVLLLITILLQMYFDLRKQAVATSTVFFVLNGALAYWSSGRGVETYGIGYAVAAFLTLLLGYLMLHESLNRLDYLTFTSQTIASDDPYEVEAVKEEERGDEDDDEEEEEGDAPAQPAAGEQAPADEPAEIVGGDGEVIRVVIVPRDGKPAPPAPRPEPVAAEAAREPEPADAEPEPPPPALPEPAPAFPSWHDTATSTSTSAPDAAARPPDPPVAEPPREASPVTATDLGPDLPEPAPDETATRADLAEPEPEPDGEEEAFPESEGTATCSGVAPANPSLPLRREAAPEPEPAAEVEEPPREAPKPPKVILYPDQEETKSLEETATEVGED